MIIELSRQNKLATVEENDTNLTNFRLVYNQRKDYFELESFVDKNEGSDKYTAGISIEKIILTSHIKGYEIIDKNNLNIKNHDSIDQSFLSLPAVIITRYTACY